jgi:hypothetical protein
VRLLIRLGDGCRAFGGSQVRVSVVFGDLKYLRSLAPHSCQSIDTTSLMYVMGLHITLSRVHVVDISVIEHPRASICQDRYGFATSNCHHSVLGLHVLYRHITRL